VKNKRGRARYLVVKIDMGDGKSSKGTGALVHLQDQKMSSEDL